MHRQYGRIVLAGDRSNLSWHDRGEEHGYSGADSHQARLISWSCNRVSLALEYLMAPVYNYCLYLCCSDVFFLRMQNLNFSFCIFMKIVFTLAKIACKTLLK
jgi:hypothetical protein